MFTLTQRMAPAGSGRSGEATVAGYILCCSRASSHDADHLLPCGLPHEPLVDDAGDRVCSCSESRQRHQPSSTRPRGETLGLGFIYASQGLALATLPRDGHPCLGSATAHVPVDVLERTVSLSTGGRSRGFTCCKRLTGRTHWLPSPQVLCAPCMLHNTEEAGEAVGQTAQDRTVSGGGGASPG